MSALLAQAGTIHLPPVRSRIFVRVREHVHGWAGPEQIFQATVPTAA